MRVVLLVGMALVGATVAGAGFYLVYAYVRPVRPEEKTALIAVVVQAVGGLLLLGGLFFTWRTFRISQETLRLNQEGRLTDRFARAVELLGATDDEGGSRLQTRLGAVLALERIGLDSERDRAQVVEVLRAYVLAKATPRERPEPDELDAVPRWAGGDVPAVRVAPDVQAVLAALTRLVPASAAHILLDLSQVDLRGARLNGVDFAGIDLTEAWLDDASLRGARFAGAKLQRSYLTKTDLSEAVLDGANMAGADLRGSLAWRTSLRGVDLGPSPPHWIGPTGPSQRAADLSVVDFAGADLSEARLEHASVQFASFSGAKLVRAGMDGVHGEGANFREADLSGASLSGSCLIDCGFYRAVLTGANLVRAEINGVLKEADLTGADLRWADLAGSNLTGTRLNDADLRGVDLSSSVGVTRAQLRLARTDEATVVPEDIEPPASSASEVSPRL